MGDVVWSNMLGLCMITSKSSEARVFHIKGEMLSGKNSSKHDTVSFL